MPLSHLPSCTLFPPSPCPPQILHNLSFSFLLGITIIQREIENNAYAKFWGANKVHHGRVQVAYGSGRLQSRSF